MVACFVPPGSVGRRSVASSLALFVGRRRRPSLLPRCACSSFSPALFFVFSFVRSSSSLGVPREVRRWRSSVRRPAVRREGAIGRQSARRPRRARESPASGWRVDASRDPPRGGGGVALASRNEGGAFRRTARGARASRDGRRTAVRTNPTAVGGASVRVWPPSSSRAASHSRRADASSDARPRVGRRRGRVVLCARRRSLAPPPRSTTRRTRCRSR